MVEWDVKEGIIKVEINNRIGKYNSNVGMVYPLLRDRNIPRRCKIIIYQSILKPILMYGSEVWSLTTKTESRLQAAEMRVLRPYYGSNKERPDEKLKNQRRVEGDTTVGRY